jgi:hypothetical protein
MVVRCLVKAKAHASSADFGIGWAAGRQGGSAVGAADIGHCWDRSVAAYWGVNMQDSETAESETGDCTAEPPSWWQPRVSEARRRRFEDRDCRDRGSN